MKKTVNVFRENVAYLLKTRGEDASQLAFWCGHDKSWASKILTGEREIRLSDIDRVADFLGVSPYQLFQPGISPLTERRVGQRRSGKDRRRQRRAEDAGGTLLQSFKRRRIHDRGEREANGGNPEK